MRRKFNLLIILSLVLSFFVSIDCTTLNEIIQAEKLDKQITQLSQQGQYQKAIPLAKEAIEIKTRIYGPEDPDVAKSLNNLGLLYDSMGAYAQAESLYQKALVIMEEKMGAEHESVAICLNNLAALYRNVGAYAQAEPLYQRALHIKEKQLGSDHSSVATSLNNLALLYFEMGSYTQAEPIYQRALAIVEKRLGPEHPKVAICLNNLALLYKTMGDYNRAEQLYQRTLEIKQQQLGPEHPSLATAFNNLAALYDVMGAYSRAEPLYQRALTIRKKHLGPEHPDVAQSINSIAGLYKTMGSYASAESLFQKALEIREKQLGSEHPDVGNSLNDLGLFYTSLGDFAKAESLYKQALKIYEKRLEPEHPDIAITIYNLALLYDLKGAYSQAELLYQRGLTIQEKQLGQEHPNVAQSLENLVYLWAAMDKMDLIPPAAKRLNTLNFNFYHRILPYLSESRQLNFMQANTLLDPLWPSLYLRYGNKNNEICSILRQVLTNHKGFILEILTTRSRSMKGENTNLLHLEENLYKIRAQLANAYLADLKLNESQDQRMKWIQHLQAQEQKLEDDIAQKSNQSYTLNSPVTELQINEALSKDVALIDFWYFQNFIGNYNNKYYGKEHYLAVVYQNNRTPEVIHFGEAEPIDNNIIELMKLIHSTRIEKSQTKQQNIVSESIIKSKAKQLYQQLTKPLFSTIGHTQKVIICANGPLHYLPFGVLVDEQNSYLVEHYQFHYVSSSRDILGWGKKEKRSLQNVVIIADPQFEAQFKMNSIDTKSYSSTLIASRSRDWRQMEFKNLKYTGPEAVAIDSMLKSKHITTKIYLKAHATESALKKVHSPNILHISTHGFFLPLPFELEHSSNIGTVSPQKTIRKGLLENPLLRCGLALTGANYAESVNHGDDGLITALEISGLDLTETDLVTLSACLTGFGELKSGEGVYGLHRSFFLAGAKTVLASLWSVPDLETKDLMVEFYRRYLSEGKMNKTEALRQAQLTVIKNLRERYGAALPGYWGAFICIGEM